MGGIAIGKAPLHAGMPAIGLAVAGGVVGLGSAAGVALAAMLKQKGALEGRKVVVLICGGNVSRDTLARVLEAGS